jgi:hypothetical protein
VINDCGGQSLSGPASLGFNLIGDTTNCDYTPMGTDIVNMPSGLDALNTSGNTSFHPLLPGSPAIDSGATSGVPSTDQRGVARPQGAGCDRGAYELVASTIPGSTCAGPPAPPGPTPAPQPVAQPTSVPTAKKCKKKHHRSAVTSKKCKKKR